MNHHEGSNPRPPGSSPLGTWAVRLLCVYIGIAVLHANLSHRSWSTGTNVEGPRFEVWCFGWPVVYGSGDPSNPKLDTQFHWIYVDLLVGVAVALSPAVAFRLRRFTHLRSTQFTLSGLFLLTTAVAIVFAFFAVERAYGWARLTWPVEPSTYSALSSCRWYDQVPISLGLVCALYMAIAALCQVFRLAVVKLRGLRKK